MGKFQLLRISSRIKIYANGATVDANMVRELVTNNAVNSLQLASAIRKGHVSLALKLVEDLIAANEPALKILATLTTAFRTLYFLNKEVANVTVAKLQSTLKILLELKLMLKTSAEEKISLQSQIIKLCT